MDGGCNHWRQWRRNPFAAMLRDAEVAPKYSLGRSGSQEHDDLRLNGFNFSLQPRPAGGDFKGGRLLMDAALASGLKLEMFHDVGDVDIAPLNTGLSQRFIQDRPSPAHQWF